MTDELDSIDSPEQQQSQIEEAAGAVHFWRGKKLEPWSFGRQAAWRRLKYNDVEDVMESTTAILYLCTLSREDCTRLRGDAIETTWLAIENWADAQGIGTNTKSGQEALSLGTTIWNESKSAQFFPVVKSTGSGPDPNESRRAS